MAKKEFVSCAEEYCEVVAKVCPGVHVKFVDKVEVESAKKALDQDIFTGCRTLPGTRKMHHVEVVSKSRVSYSNFKDAQNSHLFSFK